MLCCFYNARLTCLCLDKICTHRAKLAFNFSLCRSVINFSFLKTVFKNTINLIVMLLHNFHASIVFGFFTIKQVFATLRIAVDHARHGVHCANSTKLSLAAHESAHNRNSAKQAHKAFSVFFCWFELFWLLILCFSSFILTANV